MWPPHGSRSLRRRGRSFCSVIPTAALSSPRPAQIGKVAGLVYITAFAPDKGESVESLIKNPPPGAPLPPILPPVQSYLFLDKAKFRTSFAADVSEAKAAFLANSQVPWGVNALAGSVGEDQAQLVFGCDRGQNDSAAGPAPDGKARWRDRRGGCWQPRDLYFEAGGRGGFIAKAAKSVSSKLAAA
jgi:hypothetical protein